MGQTTTGFHRAALQKPTVCEISSGVSGEIVGGNLFIHFNAINLDVFVVVAAAASTHPLGGNFAKRSFLLSATASP